MRSVRAIWRSGSIVGDVYGLAAPDFGKLRRVYPVVWSCAWR